MAKMVEMATAPFYELVKLSSEFVTQRRGEWDHTAWLEFVSNTQQKGFDLSDQMISSLGEVLEAMKQFYLATTSITDIEKAIFSIAKDSAEFIQEHKGVWEHSEWETFTRNIEKKRLSLSEETTAYLGNILESTKAFYSLAPINITSRMVAKRSPQASINKPANEVKAKTKPAVKISKMGREKAASTDPVAPKKKSASKPSTVSDDLTVISGVGPALQKKLNTQGIHTYAQIAALSDKEIEQLEKTAIRFTGRIKRDDWIGQAKRLAKS